MRGLRRSTPQSLKHSRRTILQARITYMGFKRLSRDDLTYEAKMSRSYFTRLGKGAFHTGFRNVGRLARVLRVEPAELLRLPSKRRIR